MSTAIDASNDLHGHVLEYVADQDRAYFEAHPEVGSFQRPAVDHEFCDPRRYPRCTPMLSTPPDLGDRPVTLMVTVVEIKPGLRARSPWWAVTSWE